MNISKHTSNNMVIGAPKDEQEGVDILPLPLTRSKFGGTMSSVSFWQPNEEEISRILAGMPISVSVLGPAIYPMYVGVADTL